MFELIVLIGTAIGIVLYGWARITSSKLSEMGDEEIERIIKAAKVVKNRRNNSCLL